MEKKGLRTDDDAVDVLFLLITMNAPIIGEFVLSSSPVMCLFSNYY